MSASKIRRGTRVLGDDFPTTHVPNDDTATLSHVTHKTRRDRDANQRPQEPELTSRWAHATWQPPPREPVTPRDFRRTQRRGVGRAVAGRRVSDILGSVEDQPLPGHELRPRGGASVLTSSGIWRAPPEPPHPEPWYQHASRRGRGRPDPPQLCGLSPGSVSVRLSVLQISKAQFFQGLLCHQLPLHPAF